MACLSLRTPPRRSAPRTRARRRGRFGTCAAFSFNGNKIITTSAGGMLVSSDRAIVDRARHLSTQAREPVAHYEHHEVGYNYRMSNLLAAVGRAQLESLPAKLARRRQINMVYRATLALEPGLTFMPEASYGRSNCWLTSVLIDSGRFGADRETVRLHLELCRIEARPVWKPLHLQRAFRGCGVRGGAVASRLFEEGLCLPSGSSLSASDQRRVIASIAECRETVYPRLRAIAV